VFTVFLVLCVRSATFPSEPVDVYLEQPDGSLLANQRRRASSVFGLTEAGLLSSHNNLNSSSNNLNNSGNGRDERADVGKLGNSTRGREERGETGKSTKESSKLASLASELASSTSAFQPGVSGHASKRQSQVSLSKSEAISFACPIFILIVVLVLVVLCPQTLSLKAIRDPNTLMMRLRQDRHCLPEYVANLRYRAKRARINANMDHIVYSLKDLVASRYIDQLNFITGSIA
jgi:hypothetical protein